MEILEKIFGSAARVRLMRFFLFHPNDNFSIEDIASKIDLNKSIAKKEFNILEKSLFLIKKKISRKIERKIKGRKRLFTKVAVKWLLNLKFPYLEKIEDLIAGPEVFRKEVIVSRFNKAGKINLLIIGGYLAGGENSRLDLLIVGEKLNRRAIGNIVRRMEVEMGKELTYALFDSKEFAYRLNMRDKLVYDILENSHIKLIDKIN